jgi:hypothetical protein
VAAIAIRPVASHPRTLILKEIMAKKRKRLTGSPFTEDFYLKVF